MAEYVLEHFFVCKTKCVCGLLLTLVTVCYKIQQLYADMSLVSNKKQKQGDKEGEEGI